MMALPEVPRMLPDDWVRCRDADCPVCEQCLRYVQRDRGSSRTPSRDSCFPFDTHSVVTDACPMALLVVDFRWLAPPLMRE